MPPKYPYGIEGYPEGLSVGVCEHLNCGMTVPLSYIRGCICCGKRTCVYSSCLCSEEDRATGPKEV